MPQIGKLYYLINSDKVVKILKISGSYVHVQHCNRTKEILELSQIILD